MICRQNELLELLAQQAGMPVGELYYRRKLERFPIPLAGRIVNTDWNYAFHGNACGIRNVKDQRFIEIRFGPNGRTDTLNFSGLLHFVLTSKAPWQDFTELRDFLTEGNSLDYEQASSKAWPVFKSLLERSWLELADQTRCEAYRKERLKGLTSREMLEHQLACNKVISQLGWQILDTPGSPTAHHA
jgi:hypothetical protein